MYINFTLFDSHRRPDEAPLFWTLISTFIRIFNQKVKLCVTQMMYKLNNILALGWKTTNYIWLIALVYTDRVALLTWYKRLSLYQLFFLRKSWSRKTFRLFQKYVPVQQQNVLLRKNMLHVLFCTITTRIIYLWTIIQVVPCWFRDPKQKLSSLITWAGTG